VAYAGNLVDRLAVAFGALAELERDPERRGKLRALTIRPALTTGATAMDKILSDAAKKPWGHEPATPWLTPGQHPAAQPAKRRTTPAKPQARRRA
jgi:hypothetical protein